MPDRRFKERRGTDKIALLAMAFSALALVVSLVVSGTVIHNHRQLLDVKSGRRQGVIAVCAGQQAIINAGRQVISGSVLLPGDRIDPKKGFVPGSVTHILGPDYPSFQRRQALARKNADAYERSIAQSIVRQSIAAGFRVKLGANGKLDCDVLAKQLKTGT